MKFEIDADPFRGQVFEYISQLDLTWDEAELVEEKLGFSLTAFNDPERGAALRGSARATVTFMWISVLRERPGTTWEEITATPRAALQIVPEPPDPTEAQPTDPPTENSEPSTSPDSPTTTGSDPGSGTG